MGRLLILVALGALVVWWIVGRSQRLRRDPSSSGKAARRDAAEEMVSCAHCGVHLPRGDAVGEAPLLFCGEEHRRLGPRDR